jgi:hypothetical protein
MNEAAEKIIQKEEMPPRNSKFDEEYQIILGYKAELTRK